MDRKGYLSRALKANVLGEEQPYSAAIEKVEEKFGKGKSLSVEESILMAVSDLLGSSKELDEHLSSLKDIESTEAKSMDAAVKSLSETLEKVLIAVDEGSRASSVRIDKLDEGMADKVKGLSEDFKVNVAEVLKKVEESSRVLSDQLARTSEKLAAVEGRLGSLETRLSGVEERMHRTEAKLDSNDVKFEGVEEAVAKLEDAISTISDNVSKLSENVSLLSSRLQGSVEEVKQIRASLDSFKDSVLTALSSKG